MAMTATNSLPVASANDVLARIGKALLRVSMRSHRSSQAFKAARYASQLSQLSDEELAARGLKRHEVVQHALAGVPHF